MLRRTFATNAFVEWKKSLKQTPSQPDVDEFLVHLGRRMNTSPEELKTTYIATQTMVDFSNTDTTKSDFQALQDTVGVKAHTHQEATMAPGFAQDHATDGDDQHEEEVVSPSTEPYIFKIPTPLTSSSEDSDSDSSEDTQYGPPDKNKRIPVPVTPHARRPSCNHGEDDQIPWYAEHRCKRLKSRRYS